MDNPEQAPAWAQNLIEENKKLLSRIETLTAGSSTADQIESIEAQKLESAKLKNTSNSIVRELMGSPITTNKIQSTKLY